MEICPKCGGNNIRFQREFAGTSYDSRSRGRGLAGGLIFLSGRKKQGQQRIEYRTIGICGDCGYTWAAEEKNTRRSIWLYLLLLIVWPISLSVWFWKTNAIQIDKKQKIIILSAAWISLALAGAMNADMESDSVWASSYADLEDFKYYIDDNEIYVADYIGNDKKLWICSLYEIDGTIMSVVSFDGTFARRSLTSIVIPEGTRYLSDDAFDHCRVQYVYLPASLEEFGGWSYFRDVKKIYYGGTEEQWSDLCTVDRSEIDVVQIVCNANSNSL